MQELPPIDIKGFLEYFEERLLRFAGRDPASVEWARRLKTHQLRAGEASEFIQIAGVGKPIEFDVMFRPPRFRIDGAAVTSPCEELVSSGQNMVIFAGPGQGKTTLLHWAYRHLIRNYERVEFLPFLVPLRWPGAIEILKELVQRLSDDPKSVSKGGRHVCLLIDGYDEVKRAEQQQVSQLLLTFSALDRGWYVLTCRSYYEVFELKSTRVALMPFSENDALKMLADYLKAYQVPISAEAVLDEMKAHHLGSFAQHPLLLALVAFLKTDLTQDLPSRPVGVLERAVKLLTFKWDLGKAVRRETATPLDGDERVNLLQHLAYRMDNWTVSETFLVAQTRMYLDRLQVDQVDPRLLLQELAQQYGLLVPIRDTEWEFTHRTFHDFLAARHIVQIGQANSISRWDMRAVYAASMIPDSTGILKRMITHAEDPSLFAEALYNRAPFDVGPIAHAVVRRVQSHMEFSYEEVDGGPLVADIASPGETVMFELASDSFLSALLEFGSYEAGAGRAVACYALHELLRRKHTLRSLIIQSSFRDSMSRAKEIDLKTGVNKVLDLRSHSG